MDCLEFRRICAAEPGTADPEFEEHRASCSACAAFAKEMAALDALLVRAMRVDVPDDRIRRATQKVHPVPRWAAMAASFLLIVGVATGIWVSLPQQSLAAAVINHLHHEPYAMVRSAIEVDTTRLADVLDRYGASMNVRAETVTYVRHCYFRMKFVPHLVVQGDDGPVMLLLLPDEHVDAPMPVDEDGFRGTIYPHENGSVAVVGTELEDIDSTGKRILEAVDW